MRNRLLRFCLALAAVVICTATASSQIVWNMDNLKAVKENDEYTSVKKSCIKKADSALNEADITVVSDAKKFVEDTHNYVSIGIYWWPDSTDSTAPYIRKDGQRNPEADDYDGVKITNMKNRLKWLSIAFYLTGEEKYYDAFIKQLKVWFLDEETYMYPNFEYGQIIPGRNGNKGRDAGLIEAYDFVDVIESVRLVNSIKALNKSVMTGLKNWFSDFAQWMQTSEIGIKERKTVNNHGVAYDTNLMSMAEFISDNRLMEELTDSFRTTRLEVQINADGSQPSELARNNAFNYSVYNLTHILDFCFIKESSGSHFYEENKDKINSAFAYLWQFVNNQDAFPYKELKSWNTVTKYLRQQTARIKRLHGADLSFVPSGETLEDSITVSELLY